MEADIQALQQQMKKVEQIFVRYGAEPQDINRHNREVLGLRQEYLYRGNYYRVDHAAFDGIPYLIINQIDNPRYAAAGVMEDVEAIPITLTDEQLEKEVRYALGIEPYPEDYPQW